MTLANGIPNLAQVVVGLYRGGQPRDAAAWAFLRTLGLTSVIKLNTEPGDEISGMEVLPFPITTPEQIWGPCKEKILAAVTAIKPDTYVHCEHGCNRTGATIIAYRMLVCGWTKELAKAEADKFGFDWSLPALQVFVDEL